MGSGPRRAAKMAVVRTVRMFASASVLGFVLVAAAASPAAAHATGGPQPSDFTTVVHGVTPNLAGVSVRAIDLGAKLELRNDSPVDVTVLGYEGEPYLRVGPSGVFENTRSPAVFLNRSNIITVAAPRQYDAHAAPQWRRLSAGHLARWHDHRSHWMGNNNPPVVAHDPHHSHVLIKNWGVPLVANGKRFRISGDVVWSPGPSPWPWLLGALLIAVGLGAVARRRRLAWGLVPLLVVYLAVNARVIVGTWHWYAAPALSRLGATGYEWFSFLAVLGALLVIVRKGIHAAAPMLLVAGVFVFLGSGLANVLSLARAHVPSDLTPGADRAAIMFAIGLGAGLIAIGARRLGRGGEPGGAPGAASTQPRESLAHRG